MVYKKARTEKVRVKAVQLDGCQDILTEIDGNRIVFREGGRDPGEIVCLSDDEMWVCDLTEKGDIETKIKADKLWLWSRDEYPCEVI